MAKLKGKIAKLEDVDEQYRALYVKDGDAFVLGEYEIEDTAGLKSALEKEKKERREARALVEKYKDIDPDKAREAMQKLSELDEKHLIDKGEFDRLLQKKTDEYNTNLTARQKELDDARKRLDTYELINPVKDALIAGGVMGDRLEDAVDAAMKRVRLNDKRQVEVVDKDGDPINKPIGEYFKQDFAQAKPWLYAASTTGGAGTPANGSNGAGGAGKKTIPRAEWQKMTGAQSSAFFKDGGTVVD